MRLAVFTSQFPGRTSTFFSRDIRGLQQAGLEIDVFPIYPLDASLWDYVPDILNDKVLPPNRVHHLGFLESVRRLRPWAGRKFGRFLRDSAVVSAAAVRYGPASLAKTVYMLPKAWAWALRFADRYDHILAYWGNYTATCAYIFRRLHDRRIPFSIWLHASADLYFWPIHLRQKLLYAETIITCCAFNRRFILERYADVADRLAPKIHLCYHGLDLSSFPYRPDGRPPHKIIAVGRLANDKGFAYLLRAVHELKRRGTAVELELVGEGPERPVLERIARQLGIASCVTFRGWVKFDEVRSVMGQATLLVHPSDRLGDGLPNVLREAMALGTPVVASRLAGIPEALDDGRCGILVPPKDVGALADAIAKLLADQSLRAQYARAGRLHVERRFDLWRNTRSLADQLRATASHSVGGRQVTSARRR